MRGSLRNRSRSDKPLVLVTVDYRGGNRFGADLPLALNLVSLLERCRRQCVLVNINTPISQTLSHWPTEPFFCIADTFASTSKNARSYPGAGGLRRALDDAGRVYIGSPYRAFCRSSSVDKIVANRRLRRVVNVPISLTIPGTMSIAVIVRNVLRHLGLPVVVKRARNTGASIGVRYADCVSALYCCIDEAFRDRDLPLLIERFIPGREFTAWILDLGSGPSCYGVIEQTLASDELVLSQSAKLFVMSDDQCVNAWTRIPTGLERKMIRSLFDAALLAHQHLGLRHYSRVDLKWCDQQPYVLDVNARPHITEGGLGRLCRQRHHELGHVVVTMIDMGRAHSMGRLS